jgi:hypothetical protein
MGAKQAAWTTARFKDQQHDDYNQAFKKPPGTVPLHVAAVQPRGFLLFWHWTRNVNIKSFFLYTRGLRNRLIDAGVVSADRREILHDMLIFWNPDAAEGDKGSTIFCSVETLTKLGHSERTVRRATGELVELGLLTVKLGGGRRTNVYTVTPKLRDILFPVEVADVRAPANDNALPVVEPASEPEAKPAIKTTAAKNWEWHDGVLRSMHPKKPIESISWARKELDKVLPENREAFAAYAKGKTADLTKLLFDTDCGKNIKPAPPLAAPTTVDLHGADAEKVWRRVNALAQERYGHEEWSMKMSMSWLMEGESDAHSLLVKGKTIDEAVAILAQQCGVA